jgi:6-phosphogluconolactonase (cycloisomerase 2 family)
MKRAAVALAAVVLALSAAGASAQVNRPAVFSPDASFLYVGGSRINVLSVDGAGRLAVIDQSQPGPYVPADLAMSPDGRFLYASLSSGAHQAILIYSRDPATGLITHETTFYGGPAAGVALQRITSLTMSPDGAQLYVTQSGDDAIHVFARDQETGALAIRQSLYGGPGGDLPNGTLMDFALSPDGQFGYLAGNVQTVLRRDAQTGTLSFVQNVSGYSNAFATAVAPDGRRVYAGMTDYNVFDRDPGAGTLTFRSRTSFGESGRCGCDGRSIVVAPDSASVFSVDAEDPALHQARVTPDGVESARVYREGVDGNHGLTAPRGLALSPDGRFLAVMSNGVGAPPTESGSAAVYRLEGDRLSFASVAELPSTSSPAFLRPSITINDGAVYTNDPSVTVTVVSAPWTGSVRLSNEPNAFPLRATRVVEGGRYPWRLASTGTQRDVRRVHVRFTGSPLGNSPDLSDDIILDQRPPAVVAAKLSRSRLALRARDNRSGVRGLQMTKKRSRPGRERRFSRKVKVSRGTRVLYVRVIDGAGNSSRWKKVRAR